MRVAGLMRALRKVPSNWEVRPSYCGLRAQPKAARRGDKCAYVVFDEDTVEKSIHTRTIRRRNLSKKYR